MRVIRGEAPSRLNQVRLLDRISALPPLIISKHGPCLCTPEEARMLLQAVQEMSAYTLPTRRRSASVCTSSRADGQNLACSAHTYVVPPRSLSKTLLTSG